MSSVFDDDFDDSLDDDVPSHTSVTMKLAIIQKRCSELIDDSEPDFGGLSLADDEPDTDEDAPNAFNPYGQS